jgi:hypothetical protein
MVIWKHHATMMTAAFVVSMDKTWELMGVEGFGPGCHLPDNVE